MDVPFSCSGLGDAGMALNLAAGVGLLQPDQIGPDVFQQNAVGQESFHDVVLAVV